MDGLTRTEWGRRRLVGQLQAALRHAGGTHELFEDVVPMLRDGRAQWWERGEAVCITELRDQPQLREVNVWLAAGNLRDLLAMQEPIEAWARERGAARVIGAGRAGWARICVERMGFAQTGVTLEKRL